MVAMLTGGQTGHKQGPLRPNKIKQTKQKQERGKGKPERAKENPNDRRAKMHITAHQFCNLNEEKKRKHHRENAEHRGKTTSGQIQTLDKGRSAKKAQERQNGTAETKTTKTSNENNNTVCVQKNSTR